MAALLALHSLLVIHLKTLTVGLRLTLKPGFHYPSWRPKLTGDRSPLPVNTGRVDGHPVSTSRVDGPSTRLVKPGLTPTLTLTDTRGPVLTIMLGYRDGYVGIGWGKALARYRRWFMMACSRFHVKDPDPVSDMCILYACKWRSWEKSTALADHCPSASVVRGCGR